jgi:O-antigen/teichoic acid export membrane protein
MSEVTSTAKQAAIYALGVILNRAVSFIMIPIYTRCLTPADYGTVELLTMTIDVVSIIAGVGLSTAVYRFYYRYEGEKDRNSVISTVSILLILLYFITSSMGFLSSGVLSKLILGGGSENLFYFRLIFMCFFLQAFIEIPLIFIRAQERPVFFVLITTIKLALQLSLNIYFVVFKQMGIQGVLYSTLISSLIIGTWLIAYTFKVVGLRFSKKLALSMMVFGAPLILSNLGDFILTFSDRYFLKAYSNLTEVGIYSLGYKLGFVLWVFAAQPIFNVWGPKRFEIARRPDVQKINSTVFLLMNIVTISCGLLICLFSFDFFRIMSESNFWDAYKIVPLIVLAYIIQIWTAFCNFGIYYKGKTQYLAWSILAAAASIIVFSFILIPPLKGYGAALATIIGFSVRFGLVFYFSQRYFYLHLPWAKTLSMLAVGILFYGVSMLVSLNQFNLLLSLLFDSLIFLAFIAGILVLPIFNTEEKQVLKNVVAHPVNFLKDFSKK